MLQAYFTSLIERVEGSEEISNAGKDAGGFFEPTRAVLLQRLNMLRDLHDKPHAKPMLRNAWQYVVEHLPPEWLILTAEEKSAVQKMLA